MMHIIHYENTFRIYYIHIYISKIIHYFITYPKKYQVLTKTYKKWSPQKCPSFLFIPCEN